MFLLLNGPTQVVLSADRKLQQQRRDVSLHRGGPLPRSEKKESKGEGGYFLKERRRVLVGGAQGLPFQGCHCGLVMRQRGAQCNPAPGLAEWPCRFGASRNATLDSRTSQQRGLKTRQDNTGQDQRLANKEARCNSKTVPRSMGCAGCRLHADQLVPRGPRP